MTRRPVRLKAAYLRKQLSYDYYTKIRGALVEAGVIHWSDKFKIGSFSQSYSVSDDFSSDLAWIPLADDTVSARLHALRAERLKNLSPTHSHLRDWLTRVEIDSERAYAWIDACDSPEVAKEQYRYSVDGISRGVWHFVPDAYSRIHHNISNLKRELRKFLHIGGQPLVEVDVKSCQPLILALVALDRFSYFSVPDDVLDLCDSSFIANGMHCISKLNETSSTYKLTDTSTVVSESDFVLTESSSFNSSYSSNLLIKQKRECNASLYDAVTDPEGERLWEDEEEDDRHAMLRLCESGEFYNFLIEGMHLKRMSYKDAKQHILSSCIFTDDLYNYKKEYHVFRKHFPTVGKEIDRIRTNDYRHVAHTLQRMEARVMIEGTDHPAACQTLMEVAPEIPVLSLHDAILTTPSHAETVRQTILAAFGFYGCTPVVEVKA